MARTIIRGGTIVTSQGLARADIEMEDGAIRSIAPELPGSADEIDATGLHVFPALIDVHLHFNEPGRTEWEGAATGSRALAAGGGAVFFDMPLNSSPCTVNACEFDRKRAALEASSIADFGLWGGIVPGNVAELPGLAERGAIGFKAFLCDSGLPEFPRADDLTLYEGMREAARLGLPVAVHAENEDLTRGRAVRPLLAELEAVQRALLFAAEAKAKLHIVHLSSGRSIAMAAEARARGVDVSIETCPHYLFFTAEDVERLGAIAKCAPPLRDAADQNALWSELLAGNVDIVASDHSPAPPSMKSGDFAKAWGGIAGVQSTFNVLLEAGHSRRGLPLGRIASLLSEMPARRFAIEQRGRIAVGYSADLTLVDLSKTFKLEPTSLLQRHAISPYLGEAFHGCIRRTIRRGETIFCDGSIVARDTGKLLRPSLDHASARTHT